jgi:uncharacterized protein YbjT (DUF2867 family)
MIASEDVGRFARYAFEHPDELLGQALEIADDERTPPELAEALARVLGHPVRSVQAPLERIRAMNPEVAVMWQWLGEHGYGADVVACRAMVPDLLDFESWLRAAGWGEDG